MSKDAISDVIQQLDPGEICTFDSGEHDGSITVTRSKLAAPADSPVGAFAVRGVTSTSAGLNADEASADVWRRRRIRERARDERVGRALNRGFGS